MLESVALLFQIPGASRHHQVDLINDGAFRIDDVQTLCLWKRKSDKNLLWHTDRGGQYESESRRQLLKSSMASSKA